MIHYRVQTEEALNPTIYRSYKSASSFAKRQNGEVIAYADRQSAKNNQGNTLIVKSEPVNVTNKMIQAFVKDMNDMKRKHPSYMNAADRKKAEAMYVAVLLGFDSNGRAIDAKLICDISCRWNRSKAPIFVNGKKSNVKGLTKFIQE
tara:strand:+ start:1257 stop:1697 length:441 start_codon:yes stop_codon:yes gene_type:complete